MADLITCRLHRVLGYTNKKFGIGMGCCQLDGDFTVCNGDLEFCEKPDLLLRHVVKNFEKSIEVETNLNENVTFISLEGGI